MTECMDTVDNLGNVFLVIEICQLENEDLKKKVFGPILAVVITIPSECDRKRVKAQYFLPLGVWLFSLL